MRRFLQGFLLITIFSATANKLSAQTPVEWRLTHATYNPIDPDGAGPAKGSATFTLQIRSTSGTINNINTISTGWSYQPAKAMVPTTVLACPSTVTNPQNVTIAPTFASAGYSYNVNQCNSFTQTVGGQTFDTRAVGTLDGNPINIGTEWIDVFTVTLWALNTTGPESGYVIINSGSGGSPNEFKSYAVADADANEYPTNSLTYTIPLGLGSGVFPITLSKFNAGCTGNGASLSWETLSENNNDHFEVEKSTNGTSDWTSIANVKAAGNSTVSKDYEYVDLKGGDGFYRLKQVDNDGKSTYSSVQHSSCASGGQQLVVYPVPAKDLLNVVITSEKVVKANILLTDVSGRIVRQLDTELTKGTNNLKITVSGLTAGEYFLRVISAGGLKTRKVLIVK